MPGSGRSRGRRQRPRGRRRLLRGRRRAGGTPPRSRGTGPSGRGVARASQPPQSTSVPRGTASRTAAPAWSCRHQPPRRRRRARPRPQRLRPASNAAIRAAHRARGARRPWWPSLARPSPCRHGLRNQRHRKWWCARAVLPVCEHPRRSAAAAACPRVCTPSLRRIAGRGGRSCAPRGRAVQRSRRSAALREEVKHFGFAGGQLGRIRLRRVPRAAWDAAGAAFAQAARDDRRRRERAELLQCRSVLPERVFVVHLGERDRGVVGTTNAFPRCCRVAARPPVRARRARERRRKRITEARAPAPPTKDTDHALVVQLQSQREGRIREVGNLVRPTPRARPLRPALPRLERIGGALPTAPLGRVPPGAVAPRPGRRGERERERAL